MCALQIFKRLIWKESRENLLVMIPGFIAPAILLIFIKKRIPAPEWMLTVLVLITVMGTFLWAGEKANAKRGRNDFEDSYLLMPKPIDWLTSYLFPALIAFAMGAWLGYTLGAIPSWSRSHWFHSQQWTVLSTGLCLLSGFCMCYAASRAFGFLSGVIVGLAWLLYPGISLASNAAFGSAVDPGPALIAFMVRAAVTAALGTILLSAAFRVKPHPRFQAAPLILAVVVCYGPNLSDKLTPFRRVESSYSNYQILSNSNPDGSIVVTPIGKRQGKSASLRFISFRDGVSRERSFHQAVQPLGIAGRVVYLAQQGIGEDCVRILGWNTAEDKIRCMAKMRVHRNAILGCRCGAQSPDDRFLIFSLGAAIGNGHDLWILDTANGRHRLLDGNMSSECPQVRWAGDQASLSCGSEVMCVRLSNLKRHQIDITNPPEVQR